MVFKKRKGQVIVLFVCVVPIFLLILAGIIDYGRLQIARTYLQGATDNIALSATKKSFDTIASSMDSQGRKIISLTAFTDGKGNRQMGFADTTIDLINDNNKLNPRYVITWANDCREDNSTPPPSKIDCVYRKDKSAMVITLRSKVPMTFLGSFGFKDVNIEATGEASLKTKLR